MGSVRSRERPRNLPKMLPKSPAEITNGGLYHQAVRCGNAKCRCAAGALHEGYYYFIRRIDGRLRKTYVPKQQVDRVFLLVQESRRRRRLKRQARAESTALLADFSATLRENETLVECLRRS